MDVADQKVEQLRREYFARWEAVERVKAQELAAMTDAEAERIIDSLVLFEPHEERTTTSGLIEQQAFFKKLPRT